MKVDTENALMSKDGICPRTNKQCDDDSCTIGAICNSLSELYEAIEKVTAHTMDEEKQRMSEEIYNDFDTLKGKTLGQ